MATKDLADLKEKMTNQAEDLAAFAKQASSCEAIKKKLIRNKWNFVEFTVNFSYAIARSNFPQ